MVRFSISVADARVRSAPVFNRSVRPIGARGWWRRHWRVVCHWPARPPGLPLGRPLKVLMGLHRHRHMHVGGAPPPPSSCWPTISFAASHGRDRLTVGHRRRDQARARSHPASPFDGLIGSRAADPLIDDHRYFPMIPDPAVIRYVVCEDVPCRRYLYLSACTSGGRWAPPGSVKGPTSWPHSRGACIARSADASTSRRLPRHLRPGRSMPSAPCSLSAARVAGSGACSRSWLCQPAVPQKSRRRPQFHRGLIAPWLRLSSPRVRGATSIGRPQIRLHGSRRSPTPPDRRTHVHPRVRANEALRHTRGVSCCCGSTPGLVVRSGSGTQESSRPRPRRLAFAAAERISCSSTTVHLRFRASTRAGY